MGYSPAVDFSLCLCCVRVLLAHFRFQSITRTQNGCAQNKNKIIAEPTITNGSAHFFVQNLSCDSITRIIREVQNLCAPECNTIAQPNESPKQGFSHYYQMTSTPSTFIYFFLSFWFWVLCWIMGFFVQRNVCAAFILHFINRLVNLSLVKICGSIARKHTWSMEYQMKME